MGQLQQDGLAASKGRGRCTGTQGCRDPGAIWSQPVQASSVRTGRSPQGARSDSCSSEEARSRGKGPWVAVIGMPWRL